MIACRSLVRIIVTGAAGFIGSHVADAFAAAGHEVTGIDDLSTGRRENLRHPLHVLDIRDPATADVIAKLRPDVLCHHAAQADVRRSVADPAADADVNVVGSLRLLEACRAVACTRVLFASTGGAIYGEQDTFPAPETHPARPVSPYGVAKLAIEQYLHYYAVEHGFRATCLRYANVYGPRQNPHGEAGVVAIFTQKLLAGTGVTINGDGEQTRDFVYVGDVARANVLALETGITGAFNVGTGMETSINAIHDRLVALTGGNPGAHAPAKPGEQRRSVIDAAKLRAATGWSPAVALDDGMRRTVDYFK